MSYVLPKEYTEAMKPLQDRCPTTPLSEIDLMLQQDLGQSIDELFSSFDPKPLGVASLAQVHKATLRSGPFAGREVAVKFQHPNLEHFATIDIATVSNLVEVVRTVFPSFEFSWLADQMKENLPKELDFKVEAENAARLATLFADHPLLKVPEVYWAHKRAMAMEFIHGSRIDDASYLAKHNIDPHRVSYHFADIFSRMIFKEGFVHADPHPGNVLIRPRKGVLGKDNFQIVLLDHGLYRELNQRFQVAYAGLWSSLIRGDENGIMQASYRLFQMAREDEVSRRRARGDSRVTVDDIAREQGEGSVPSYRLFASVLTGRPWRVVVLEGGEGVPEEEVANYLADRKDPSRLKAHEEEEREKEERRKKRGGSGLTSARSDFEREIVTQIAGTGEFLFDVADVLAKVPRELVLLLKTNDLLRAVDEDLGIGKPPSGSHENPAQVIDRMQAHMVRMVVRMGWWVARCLYEDKKRGIVEGVWWRRWTSRRMWKARWEFWSVTVRVWVGEMWIGMKDLFGVL